MPPSATILAQPCLQVLHNPQKCCAESLHMRKQLAEIWHRVACAHGCETSLQRKADHRFPGFRPLCPAHLIDAVSCYQLAMPVSSDTGTIGNVCSSTGGWTSACFGAVSPHLRKQIRHGCHRVTCVDCSGASLLQQATAPSKIADHSSRLFRCGLNRFDSYSDCCTRSCRPLQLSWSSPACKSCTICKNAAPNLRICGNN